MVSKVCVGVLEEIDLLATKEKQPRKVERLNEIISQLRNLKGKLRSMDIQVQRLERKPRVLTIKDLKRFQPVNVLN